MDELIYDLKSTGIVGGIFIVLACVADKFLGT